MRCRARSQLVQPGFGPVTPLSSISDLRSFIFSVLSSRLHQVLHMMRHTPEIHPLSVAISAQSCGVAAGFGSWRAS